MSACVYLTYSIALWDTTGLIHTLSTLLQHFDVPVRYRSAHCLQLAAGNSLILAHSLTHSCSLSPALEHALGRQYFLDLKIIPALSNLVCVYR